MRALVLGYGSAGQRHARGLRCRGFDAVTYDPNPFAPSMTHKLQELEQEHWDLVVVASPPDCHLQQIRWGIERGARVLCEKPLCGFGQLHQAQDLLSQHAAEIMLAYNYRFHSAFEPINLKVYREPKPRWILKSAQSRKRWPAWGFLLDHMAHALDMLYWQAGPLRVERCQHVENPDYSGWLVSGVVERDGLPFMALDDVYTGKLPRNAYLKAPQWWASIYRDLGMFEGLWDSCLHWLSAGGQPYPGLQDALVVQGYLEDAYRLVQIEASQELACAS